MTLWRSARREQMEELRGNRQAWARYWWCLRHFCWGLSGGIGGILISEGWSPTVVSLYRGLIGLVCVLIWLALRPAGSGMTSPRLWFWSVIAGIGVAGNFSFYFLSIAEGSVAVAATLMYSAPVFVYWHPSRSDSKGRRCSNGQQSQR